MVKNIELYRRLGVGHNTPPNKIKAAYKRRAARTHPDVGGDAEEFVRVREAYDVLIDEDRRDRYDLTGEWDHGVSQSRMHRVHTFIAELFNMAINQGLAFDARQPLMELMVKTAEKQSATEGAKAEKLRAFLENLDGLRDRISRQDDGDNVFVRMTDTRIKAVRKQLGAVEDQSDIAARAAEEMGLYESVDQVVRQAQFWIRPGDTATGTNTTAT